MNYLQAYYRARFLEDGPTTESVQSCIFAAHLVINIRIDQLTQELHPQPPPFSSNKPKLFFFEQPQPYRSRGFEIYYPSGFEFWPRPQNV